MGGLSQLEKQKTVAQKYSKTIGWFSANGSAPVTVFCLREPTRF